MQEFGLRWSVAESDNHRLNYRIGQIRRLGDELGLYGMRSKKGQKNEKYIQQGFLENWFPNRRLRNQFEELVLEWHGDVALVNRRKRRKKAGRV